MKRMPKPMKRMAGLTLLEILVAMMIGLIGIVVITQTYIVNENYKRSTTSAGSAQTNGSLALYSIERDIRMSGWGIALQSALGCTSLRWYYNGAYSNPPLAGGTLPALSVAPVVITDGGAGPDTITVFYGTGTERVIPAKVAVMLQPHDPFQVDNPQGFSHTPGDLVLVTQAGTCALAQLTNVGAATGIIRHDASPTALYNPVAGTSLLPAFGAGAEMFNLGRPVVNVYSIAANNLRLANLFSATSSTVVPGYTPAPFTIVEDIVDLQAEYGKDNGIDNNTVESAAFVANDGRVDSYSNVQPANATEWKQVLSIRVGVLARSEYYEKPDPPGAACNATIVANAPAWARPAQAFPGLGDLADPTNLARCYRYRIFETVVPIRNMIWSQG